MDLETALQRLELDSSAKYADAQRAYRDLVRIWHPDRYLHDARLAGKAKLKTQELNAAWNVIRSLGEKKFNTRSSSYKKQAGNKAPNKEPEQSKRRVTWRGSFVRLGVVAVGIFGLISANEESKKNTYRNQLRQAQEAMQKATIQHPTSAPPHNPAQKTLLHPNPKSKVYLLPLIREYAAGKCNYVFQATFFPAEEPELGIASMTLGFQVVSNKATQGIVEPNAPIFFTRVSTDSGGYGAGTYNMREYFFASAPCAQELRLISAEAVVNNKRYDYMTALNTEGSRFRLNALSTEFRLSQDNIEMGLSEDPAYQGKSIFPVARRAVDLTISMPSVLSARRDRVFLLIRVSQFFPRMTDIEMVFETKERIPEFKTVRYEQIAINKNNDVSDSFAPIRETTDHFYILGIPEDYKGSLRLIEATAIVEGRRVNVLPNAVFQEETRFVFSSPKTIGPD